MAMDGQRRPHDGRRWGAFGAAILIAPLLMAAGAGGAPPPSLPSPPLAMPTPAPQGRAAGFDVAAANVDCEGCHVEIAKEWRGSLHQTSWTDPLFLKAYSIEPTAFCRSCHAPEADPSQHPNQTTQDIGVGCITCHVRDGHVLGAKPTKGSAHAVVVDARLGTEAACAGCHQFDFPLQPGLVMQDTLGEHRSSKHASEPCQSCHMPAVGKDKHRSHDFRVMGNQAKLEQAVIASASRLSDKLVTMTLAAAKVGHAVPTGDMFRRLELRAGAVDGQGKVVAMAIPLALERRFEVTFNPQIHRSPLVDNRLPASGESRRFVMRFPVPVDGLRIEWEVAHQRMSPSMADVFDETAVNDTVIARGSLAPERAR